MQASEVGKKVSQPAAWEWCITDHRISNLRLDATFKLQTALVYDCTRLSGSSTSRSSLVCSSQHSQMMMSTKRTPVERLYLVAVPVPLGVCPIDEVNDGVAKGWLTVCRAASSTLTVSAQDLMRCCRALLSILLPHHPE